MTRSSSAFWVNNDARLRELWADRRLSTPVIASMLGAISKYAVIGRAHRIGLAPKDPKRPHGLPPTQRSRKTKTMLPHSHTGSTRFKAMAPAIELPPTPISDIGIPQAQRCD